MTTIYLVKDVCDIKTLNLEKLSSNFMKNVYKLNRKEQVEITIHRNKTEVLIRKDEEDEETVEYELPKLINVSQIYVSKMRVGNKSYHLILNSQHGNVYLRIYHNNEYTEHEIASNANLPRDVVPLYVQEGSIYCIYNTINSPHQVVRYTFETVKQELEDIYRAYLLLKERLADEIEALYVVIQHGIKMETEY